MKTDKIEEKIKKVQSEKRFAHTKGVQYTAMCLAMKYDEDIEKASLAGLLHDCAKHLSDEKLIALCDENDIETTDIERKNPVLLHGKVGALIARKKFKIEDEDLLNAITYHTTGRPGMSMLEKIIYVADYIEPGRDKMDRLPEIREAAFTDIDSALKMILEDTINHIKSKGYVMDPMTEKTFLFYKDK